MGYLHINNLYKCQDVLMFKRLIAMEKIHGTSARISWNGQRLMLHPGGESMDKFSALFDKPTLAAKFATSFDKSEVAVFGEAYGGKQQGMSATYGRELKFVVFDVKIANTWLSVANAHAIAATLGLEFVHYVEINGDIATIDAERDADSIQAIRNGVGPGKKREGIVLRPLIELHKNNGERIIAKHKRDDFKETKTSRTVSPEAQAILTEASAIADEWVVHMRLKHVLDKIPGAQVHDTPKIIAAMIEDVYREGKGEIVESKDVERAIGRKTAAMFKQYLKDQLKDA